MSKLPPVPSEQKSFGAKRGKAASGPADRRDLKTGLQSAEPGDADTNLDQQGRQGNTRQNLTPQKGVQSR